jgi:hypothetical protein
MTTVTREDKEMEDKKYYKDELQKLGIEDLESVAGGYTAEQLTEEERKRAHELDAKWKKAVSDCMDGKISDGREDKTPSFFQEYCYKLEKLYDRFYTDRGRELALQRRAAAVRFYENLYEEVTQLDEQGKIYLERHLG